MYMSAEKSSPVVSFREIYFWVRNQFHRVLNQSIFKHLIYFKFRHISSVMHNELNGAYIVLNRNKM